MTIIGTGNTATIGMNTIPDMAAGKNIKIGADI